MYAALAALEWPSEPHLRLWHAATRWREHRGDGHVAALTTRRIDGCEAHVLAAAAGTISAERQREHRGWSDQEWAAGAARLRERGLLLEDGSLSAEGIGLRQLIEDLTDDLSSAPPGSERLEALMAPIVDRIDRADGVPHPNGMGLPRRTTATADG